MTCFIIKVFWSLLKLNLLLDNWMMTGVLYKCNNIIFKIFLYLTCFKIKIIWLPYMIFNGLKMLLYLPLFHCYYEIEKNSWELQILILTDYVSKFCFVVRIIGDDGIRNEVPKETCICVWVVVFMMSQICHYV